MLQFSLQELSSPSSRGQCESTAACRDLRERHPMPLCVADSTVQGWRRELRAGEENSFGRPVATPADDRR